MARPRKKGLDYFPHDVDLSGDEKIESLEATFGLEGYAVYLKFTERIYREGDRLTVTKDTLAIFARRCNITETRLDDILEKIFDKELLDREKFLNEGVLTSKGIRKRYRWVQRNRLKWREKKGGLSPGKTGGKQGENPIKNSIVKNRIEKKRIQIPDWVPREPWDGFVEMRKKIRAPMTDHAIKLNINELAKLVDLGHDPKAVLNQSIRNSWKGLFPLKDGGSYGRNQGSAGSDTKTPAGGVRPTPGKYD